uniref:Uncharacterized protein n=1 Tax=Fagus sylvatica TaxID=28930 RepID=A0A2N9E9D7_FAGSY
MVLQQTADKIKCIVDEVAVESTDDVTVDFDDEVVVEAVVDVIADFNYEAVIEAVVNVTTDFNDEVEYAQSESPGDSDSIRIALEVADLHLALVTYVVVVEVTVDTSTDVSADVADVLFSSRKRFRFRMMFPLRKRFWLRNDVAVVDAASEVAADATDFVFPLHINYLDVVADAANFVEVVAYAASEITADAIDIATNLDNDNTVAVVDDISSEIIADATDFELMPKIQFEDAYVADMEDTVEVPDSCDVVLVGGYEHGRRDSFYCNNPQDRESSNNKIRMMENEGVDVTKAIGLVTGVTAKVHTDSVWCYDRSPYGIYVIDILMSDCKSDDIAFIVPWKWISFEIYVELVGALRFYVRISTVDLQE